jgi:5-formyltetrahydrofolate cyclo-ligase
LIGQTWQVVEAAETSRLANPDLDLVIVPMLGFDKHLNRIGYGGGYYDRLLSYHPDALKVGVCYAACEVEQILVEEHDINLDIIITEHIVFK